MKTINFSVLTAFAISAAASTALLSAPAQASTMQANAGICSGYISPNADPNSFEYREGLYRCQYGTD